MSQDRVIFGCDTVLLERAAIPEMIVLVRDRSRLRLTWPSGKVGEINANHLRGACPCAECTRSRFDGSLPSSFHGILIAAIGLIGDYAINIAFTDGHARGIFPWRLLNLLAGHDDLCSPATSAETSSSQELQHDGLST